MLVLQAVLPGLQQQQHGGRLITLVDFGCGTGSLALALAHWLPDCQLVGVDMKPEALRLLRERAAAAGLTNVSAWQVTVVCVCVCLGRAGGMQPPGCQGCPTWPFSTSSSCSRPAQPPQACFCALLYLTGHD